MTNWPIANRSRLSNDRFAIAAAVVVSTTIGAMFAGRAGYGPDEEITFFAVEGIRLHGAPNLPSGILYLRGPLYSYLAWLSGLLGGHDFVAYRWLGIAGMAMVIAATATLARGLFGNFSAVAAWLIAVSPITTSSGAYARFYMPFAAVCTLTLIAASRMRERPALRIWFVVGCVIARSLHEFGLLLALVPAAAWLCAESDDERRSSIRLLLITTAVLAAEHAILLWLPCVSSDCGTGVWGLSSTGIPAISSTALPVAVTATRAELLTAMAIAITAVAAGYRAIRGEVLFLIAAAGAAALFANGVVVALIVLWSIARPHHAGRIAGAGLLAVIVGSALWIVVIHNRSAALVDTSFAWQLLRGSFVYPWSGIQFLVAQQPVGSAAIALGVWRTAFAGSAPRPVAGRMLALLLFVELLSFGVVGIDVRSRFLVLLMPLFAVFAGAGIAWLAAKVAELVGLRLSVLGRIAGVAVAILAVGYVAIEQASAIVPHRPLSRDAARWAKWAPPVALSTLAFDRNQIATDAVVVTNDELAALLVLGRVDYWWAPDAISAERYGVTNEHGQQRGMYAGATVLADSSSVRRVIESHTNRMVIVALFNTGKFGFDPSTLQSLRDTANTVELDERSNEWIVARYFAPP